MNTPFFSIPTSTRIVRTCPSQSFYTNYMAVARIVVPNVWWGEEAGAGIGTGTGSLSTTVDLKGGRPRFFFCLGSAAASEVGAAESVLPCCDSFLLRPAFRIALLFSCGSSGRGCIWSRAAYGAELDSRTTDSDSS
jgi:hypothetical protein